MKPHHSTLFAATLVVLAGCSYPIESEWAAERRFVNALPGTVTLVVGNEPGDTIRYDIPPGDTLALPIRCFDGICDDQAYLFGVGADVPSVDVPGSFGHFIFEFSDGQRAQYRESTCDSIDKSPALNVNVIGTGLKENFVVTVADSAVYCGWRSRWSVNPRVDTYTYVIDSVDYRWAR